MKFKDIDISKYKDKTVNIITAYRVPLMFAVFIITVLILSRCSQ